MVIPDREAFIFSDEPRQNEQIQKNIEYEK